MRKSYHLAMVQDKKGFGLGALLKIGIVVGGLYYGYKWLSEEGRQSGEPRRTKRAESQGAGEETAAGAGKAAKEISDFAARVLKAAKKTDE
jgi:hypothetical protein